MPDSQERDGVLQYRLSAIVSLLILVGDVSVDKDLAGFPAEDDGFGDSRVGAYGVGVIHRRYTGREGRMSCESRR